MLYPVEKLIKDQELLCVTEEKTVRDAQTVMLAHDYSQLPIVDGEGNLKGSISEQSIARNYYHVDEGASVLDLKVTSCSDPQVTISIEQDVFEVLDLLEQTFAVVVVDEPRPVGIITNYDTTEFFRDLSEGLILVEDIEVTLRQYIDKVLPEEKDRQEAMFNAFKHLMKNDAAEAPTFDRMSFGDYITLITNRKNWPRFEELLESRELFRVYMDQVREIRNQLAHFRGRLDAIQYDVLKRVRNWLANRPADRLSTQPAMIAEPGSDYIIGDTGGKYGPLEDWLKSHSVQARSGTDIQRSFSQIEELIDDKLPPSAREHRAWWANDPTTGRQSMAWMRAGWRVENVDFPAETVTFQRTDSVLYQVFYTDLLVRLKEQRPGLTRATKPSPRSYWGFSSGRSGFGFGWMFDKDGQLRTNLYIDVRDKEQNKQLFDSLYEQKDEIEQAIGYPLTWERLDHRQASRVSKLIPATINDDPQKLEETKVWALKTVQEFVDAFQKRIKQLPV